MTPPQASAERLLGEVRAEMARQRLSQGDLADLLGISQSALSRRLAGASEMRVAELLCICDAIQVPLATLASRAGRVAA